jgi:hypothetical protein
VRLTTPRDDELRLQEGDHRKHTPMRIGGDGEPKLLEDARHVFLDAAIGQEDARRDRRVRQSFGHQPEHLSLSRTQLADWIVTASPAHEL